MQNIINEFKSRKKQFANIYPVSKQPWILLQQELISELEGPSPLYKVPVEGLADAVLNHEMYQEMFGLNQVQMPYSYVFFGKNLIFLITYNGLIYNRFGMEININTFENITQILKGTA